jgi:hypothetical protein
MGPNLMILGPFSALLAKYHHMTKGMFWYLMSAEYKVVSATADVINKEKAWTKS